MRINNNMSAVITNNQLLGTESTLADVMEKLSSGFSINHAGDNPSGIAIAGKMQSQIDGLNKASDNGNDGISVLQTAEGALQEVTSMLQRMRELSVQAANGTNSTGERDSIQLEIESLKKEIDRISSSTEFNTLTLLDGSLDNRTYADNCSRIQTSDTVAAGEYRLTIDKAAVPATLTSVHFQDAASNDLSFVEAIDANGGLAESGTLSINNVTIELTKGMSGEQVYEFIRQTAELGAAKVSDPTSNSLQISTNKYGADANLVVAFSSTDFATALGFTNTTLGITEHINNTSGETFKKYIDSQEYTKVITKADGSQEVEKSNGISVGGKINVNGLELEIKQGMHGADIYTALKALATKSQTDANYDAFTITDIADGADAKLELDGVKSISYSSKEFADALGLEYRDENKVEAKPVGTNAQVTLNKTASESQFGKQATVSTDGNQIKVTDTNGFELSFLVDVGFQKETVTPGDGLETGEIVFNVTNIGSMTLQIGANQGQTMDVRIGCTSTEYMYIDDLDVTISNGPEDAMNKLDDALTYITSIRAQIGAYENRLDHTVNSLDETSENMTSAISRIEDADMATTMVEYTKLNVLEQAGTSALAQANELPQLALQLLQ